MQEIGSSNPPVVTGSCDPNKYRARLYRSLKLGSKLKYLNKKSLQPIDLGNNKFLPIVTRVSYLRTNLNNDCRNNKDVVFRIKKVGNAFYAPRKCLFSNSNISVVAIRAVYVGLIPPILLYGAESWCLTEKLFSVLRIFIIDV